MILSLYLIYKSVNELILKFINQFFIINNNILYINV